MGNSPAMDGGSPRRWRWLALAVVAAIVLIGAFLADAAVQSWLVQHQIRGLKVGMRNISRVGDWPSHLFAGLVGAGIAYLRGSRHWVRIFTAMIVACALAGSLARIGKIATGRARPAVTSEAAWTGPRLGSRYHAFPSGHTAASTAFFVTLLCANRRFGAAFLAIPVVIAFSRMYVAAHYLSDVVAGALVGVVAAIIAWGWFVQRRAKVERLSSSTRG